MSRVGHDTLDKRTDAAFLLHLSKLHSLILDHRSDCLNCLYQNAFIRSVDVRVIKSRGVKKSHISNCSHLYTRSHSFERFHTFEFAWNLNTLVVILWDDLSHIVQECWLSLTTLPKYYSCPDFHRLIIKLRRV